jgi:hypothetical protein
VGVVTRTLRLADNTDGASLASHLRARRIGVMIETLRIDHRTRILDVGGSEQLWREFHLAAQVTLLNLERSREDSGLCEFVCGDALAMPFADGTFDVVVSNSVIEHVGDAGQQERFADEVRRVGARYWVQTPNRHFPIEPHFLFPGFQFLPRPIQSVVAQRWPYSWPKRYGNGPSEIEEEIRSIRLLAPSEMTRFFPDAAIYTERVFGLTKSFAMYRR